MVSIRHIARISFITLTFFCSSSLLTLQAMDTREQLETKGSRINQMILHKVGEKLQDYIESQKDFYADRIEYFEECLANLRNIEKNPPKDSPFPQEAISDLKAYYEQNLEINRFDKKNTLTYENIIKDYLNSEAKAFTPTVETQNKFRKFMWLNGFSNKLLGFDQAQEAALIQLRELPNAAVEELDSIYYEELKRYGLEGIANDFSKAHSLSIIFKKYLEGQTSFLIGRHHERLSGKNLPSTKLEDWPSLDKFDREKVNVTCTGFGNFLKPLLAIYQVLQQVSGGQNPTYLLDQQTQQLLNASKVLLPYLYGQEEIVFSDLLDPDAFLEDVDNFMKLDIPLIPQVMKKIVELGAKKTLQPSTTQLSQQKTLSRQERRALELKAKKQKKREDKRLIKNPKTAVSPKAPPSLEKIQIKRLDNSKIVPTPVAQPSQQKQTQQLPKKVEIQPIKSKNTNSNLINLNPTLTMPTTPERSASVVLSSPSTSTRTQEEENIPALKPKRWRGDLVVREKNKEKTLLQQLMNTVEEIQNNEVSTSQPSSSAISPTTLISRGNLRITSLVKEDNLPKTALVALDLLLDKKTHPYTITRKQFLHLLEKLGVEATPTTGSIYSLSYTNIEGQEKTKTMHIWKQLGRNMMNRARFVLQEFGFLE